MPSARKREARNIPDARFNRAKERMFSCLRSATVDEYNKWLVGFLLKGGKPTIFDMTFNPKGFYVAESDFQLVGLTGVDAVEIIIPEGIKVKHDLSAGFKGLGHTNLYFMDKFEHEGFHVPVFR